MRQSVPVSLRYATTEKSPDDRKIGKFMTHKQREEISQVTKKSNFTFGHSANQVLTTSQQFYGGVQMPEKSENRALLRNKNRTAHFSIGRENSPFQRETTAGISFQKLEAESKQPAGEAVSSGGALRASHVNLASPSTKTSYWSEAAYKYKAKQPQERVLNKEAAHNLAAHHFVFGRDPVKLKTSSELYLPPHQGNLAAQAITSNEMKTQSSIQFGQHPSLYTSTTGMNHAPPMLSSIASAGAAKINAKLDNQIDTHFSIAHQQSPTNYTTAMKAQFADPKMMKTLEVQSPRMGDSSIIFGRAPRQFSPSSTNIGLGTKFSPNRTLPPPGAYEKSDPLVRKLLNHGTLHIGHHPEGSFHTTYQRENRERNLAEARGHRKDGSLTLDSHFTLNESFPNAYSTETKERFLTQGQCEQVDKQSYVGHLKSHHFSLGPTDRFDGQTSQKVHYAYQGDASKIKAKFETQLMKDTTATHFVVGSDPTGYITNQRDFGSPGNKQHMPIAGGRADGKPMGGVKHPTALDLKKTKLELGNENAGSYMTNNQANYHWIQPVEQTRGEI